MLYPDHTGSEPILSTRTHRAEIDDFLRLLDAARAHVAAATPFTLALLAPRRADAGTRGDMCCREADFHAEGREADALIEDHNFALTEAHNFLALNLRRRDEVAFYGPTLLAVLLPAGHARRAADDFARLLTEFHDTHPHTALAVGLASFPADGAEIEALVGHAEATLDAELARASGDDKTADSVADAESVAPASATELAGDEHGGRDGGIEENAVAGAGQSAQEFLPLYESGARSSAEWRVGPQSQEQEQSSRAPSKRGLPAAFAPRRALRESKHGDDFEAAVQPSFEGAAAGGSVLARAAAEAAARERARRAGGARRPRRLLLAVSDAARMAQVNLLLRSAGYEVRAAFDGKQTLDLLRIERADLLVLDFALAGVDGLEVLRRLDERHGGRLPLPVVLLVPAERDGEELRAGAAQLGAGGFVSLPYDPQELLDCIAASGADG